MEADGRGNDGSRSCLWLGSWFLRVCWQILVRSCRQGVTKRRQTESQRKRSSRLDIRGLNRQRIELPCSGQGMLCCGQWSVYCGQSSSLAITNHSAHRSRSMDWKGVATWGRLWRGWCVGHSKPCLHDRILGKDREAYAWFASRSSKGGGWSIIDIWRPQKLEGAISRRGTCGTCSTSTRSKRERHGHHVCRSCWSHQLFLRQYDASNDSS